jgi:hypothetical protein
MTHVMTHSDAQKRSHSPRQRMFAMPQHAEQRSLSLSLSSSTLSIATISIISLYL